MTPLPAIVPVWKAMKLRVSAPYTAFIYPLVCFTCVAASGVFLLASATAQGSPTAFTENSFSLVGLIFTAIWASRSWTSITRAEPEYNLEFRRKHRAFGLKAGAIILSVLVCMAVAGGYRGVRAGHITKVESLLKEMEELGVKGAPQEQLFVKLAREDAKDFPRYLQRCAELESAINDYETTERQMDNLWSQLQQEVAELKPQANYSSLLPMFSVMKMIRGKDLEQAKAYRQEIEYAKQLPDIPMANRLRFYNANIQPVVEQEQKIAQDEIQIMKDAKARGVDLPDNMLQDAGIR